MTSPPRILHCHSTFSAGGKEVRCAQLVNALGKGMVHHIVSAMPDQMGAAELIDPALAEVRYPEDFPALTGKPTPGRLAAIAKALKPYDLILTYNWGAMDAAMAHTVFAQQFGLPPLIHHEDGFNEDEVAQRKWTRNIYRRAALRQAHALVVPSETLERIAIAEWQQPRERIVRIPNGIDTAAFARTPDPARLRLVKREGERWIGTLAGLRKVKQLPLLIEAAERLPEEWHVVILGEGPEHDAIQQAAIDRHMAHRVHLPGAVKDPASVIGLFDIFALSSRSEQFPLSVVEAMAAGLPVVAPDVGDIRRIVAEPNRPFIAVPDDAEAMAILLGELASDPELRAEIGRANRDKAAAQFDRARMVDSYAALYGAALGDKWAGPPPVA